MGLACSYWGGRSGRGVDDTGTDDGMGACLQKRHLQSMEYKLIEEKKNAPDQEADSGTEAGQSKLCAGL
eukprot:9484914-Pyramimonas_sp.AAC.1